jgi:long-chain fatty acid transport protein
MLHRRLVGTILGLALVATPGRRACATDGHFLHGVGAINAAMGGAGVAAPLSLLGTFYLNPAGLMAFDGTRVEFGFELFKPDRSVSSTAGPTSGTTGSTSDWTPIPAMAWTTKLKGDRVVVGVAGLGVGGFGVDYPASTTNPILAPQPNGFGQVFSNYQLLKIIPAIAFAPTPKLWLGAAANIDWAALSVEPMPVAAPTFDPVTRTAFYSSAAAAAGAFGFGFQVGALFKPNDLVTVGASYTSQQRFQNFQFHSTYANPNLSSYGTPRTITFKLNVPAMLVGGVALTAVPNLLLTGEARYIFYENAAGFEIPQGQSISNPDGSVKAFGWRNITSLHGGVQYRATDQVAIRGGYNWTQNPIPDSLAMFNVPAPAIVQSHVTLGLGVRPSRHFEISAAYYHAFAHSGTGPLFGPSGPVGTVTNTLSENSLLVTFSFATRGGSL